MKSLRVARRLPARRSLFQAIEPLENRRLLTSTPWALTASNPLTQNWESVDFTTANDWSGVPSFQGFGMAGTANNVDPQTLLDGSAATVLNIGVYTNQNPNSFTNAGNQEFEFTTPITGTRADSSTTSTGSRTVAFQGSGNATLGTPFITAYLDTTGLAGNESVRVRYDLIDIDAGAATAAQQVALHYRTSPTGDWINVPAGYVAAAGPIGSTAGFATLVDATLPADAANQANLEIRIVTANAGGNDQFIAVENISISAEALAGPGDLSFNPITYNVAEDAGTFTVTVKRTGGTTGAVSANWALVHGTTDAADFVGATSGTVNFADGADTATFTLTVDDDAVAESTETFSIQLTDPTGGASIVGGSATGSITDNDTIDGGVIAFNPAGYSVNEGGSVVLTVKRTGDTSQAVTATYTIVDDTALAGSDFALPGGSATGIVSFDVGADTAQITIVTLQDTDVEANETFTVVLSAPTGGATLGTNITATVTINDDDATAPEGLLINEVYVNPPGANNPYQFIELKGAPGTTLHSVYLLVLEGDFAGGSNPGQLDQVIDLSGAVVGSNGLLLVRATSTSGGFDPEDEDTGVFKTPVLNATLEVGSISFVLVFRGAGDPLPAVGTDLDLDNEIVDDEDPLTNDRLGTLEALPSNVVILDGVGSTDSNDTTDLAYGAWLPRTASSRSADAMVRFDGNNDPLSTAAWYYGDLEGPNSVALTFTEIAANRSANFPEGGLVTPGARNVPFATGDTDAPTVVSATFDRIVGQKLVVVFSEDVRNITNDIAASDFVLVGTSPGSVISDLAVDLVVDSISGDGTTVTLTFANTGGVTNSILKSGNYSLTVKAGQIADLAANTLAADSINPFKFMNGDADGDAAVTFNDLLLLAQNYGATSGKDYATGDFNYDGAANFEDLLVLAQNYGVSLPALLAAFDGMTNPPKPAAPAKAPAAATSRKPSFGSTVIA